MKIIDYLNKESIIADLQATTKNSVLKELVEPLAKRTGLPAETLQNVLIEREQLGSTGIGGGIGIPHGKMKLLTDLLVGFGLSRPGVDFESIDGRPTHIFFLLLTPENSTGSHLKLLARISRLLKNDLFKRQLLNATDRDEIYRIIRENDEAF